jgi:hypothetical protein
MGAAQHLLRVAILAVALGEGTVLLSAYAQSSVGLMSTGDGTVTAPSTSSAVDVDKTPNSTKSVPAFRPLPILAPEFTDWWKPYADAVDAQYDKWLMFKKAITDQFNLDLALDYSLFLQWGTKGNPIYLNIYYPSATWRPFTDTAIGSGEIDVVTSHQDYASKQDAVSQAARLGLISFANDWPNDDFAIYTLTYKHTLPENWSWLSVTVGQYNLFSFDPNQYAANAQKSFINYSFAQDGTETFPYAGFGGFGQVKVLDGQVSFASGVQGGTDPNGGTLTASGFHRGRLVRWGNVQWTPKINGLGNGVYSLLIYEQPFVPPIASHSTGISVSASQEITNRYGAFLRINNATGPDLPVRASYAAGGVWNDPLVRNGNDQLGLAVGWNKTNRQVLGSLAEARSGEWVAEVFYRANIFKGMHITPDVQVFRKPVLAPAASPTAVFTLRTTVSF